MRKTPSYLKGLAETRARLAGDIERYRSVIEDVGRQMLKAETELEACDLLIRKFDSRLRPECVFHAMVNGVSTGT